MLSLAELQRDIARALVEGAELPAHPLVGGAQPRRRLAIHRRHFAASLAAALLQKFPACAWLTGAELIAAAAQAFVRAHPPRRPCIAEYGREFPVFLGAFDGAAARPELQSFAELEWAAGRASIAVDATPLAWPTLASLGVERLAAARLVLQPAVAYAASRWRIDDTLGAYLRGEPPHTPSAGQTYVEIRGARGELSLTRLDPATHAFRAALAGAAIGAAAEDALEIDARFDVGAALRALVAAGLAIAVRTDEEP